VARKTVIELIDDLDGSKADETVTFGIDGVTYEIDLSADHAEDLRSIFEAYVKAGRKVANRPRRKSRTPKVDTRAVRKWAQAQGYEVSERGRIPQHILDAYQKRTSDA